jgi:hypothetical protein
MKNCFLLLALVACTTSTAAPPKVEPVVTQKNIICERFALVNPSAKCTPEYNGVGDQFTHSATVKVGENVLSCAINSATLSVVCGQPIVVQQVEQPKTDAPQPPPKK